MPLWIESRSHPSIFNAGAHSTRNSDVDIPSPTVALSHSSTIVLPPKVRTTGTWTPSTVAHSRASLRVGTNPRSWVGHFILIITDRNRYLGSGARIVRGDRTLLCRSAALLPKELDAVASTGAYKNATYRGTMPWHRNHSSYSMSNYSPARPSPGFVDFNTVEPGPKKASTVRKRIIVCCDG